MKFAEMVFFLDSTNAMMVILLMEMVATACAILRQDGNVYPLQTFTATKHTGVL